MLPKDGTFEVTQMHRKNKYRRCVIIWPLISLCLNDGKQLNFALKGEDHIASSWTQANLCFQDKREIFLEACCKPVDVKSLPSTD